MKQKLPSSDTNSWVFCYMRIDVDTNLSENPFSGDEKHFLAGWPKNGVDSKLLTLYGWLRYGNLTSQRELAKPLNVNHVQIHRLLLDLERLGFIRLENEKGSKLLTIFINPVPDPEFQDTISKSIRGIKNDDGYNDICTFWSDLYRQRRGGIYKFTVKDYAFIKALRKIYSDDQLKELMKFFATNLLDVYKCGLTLTPFRVRIQDVEERYKLSLKRQYN